jgi:hypothetical protein
MEAELRDWLVVRSSEMDLSVSAVVRKLVVEAKKRAVRR